MDFQLGQRVFEGMHLVGCLFPLGIAFYFRFFLSRRGTKHLHPRSIFYRCAPLPWGFLGILLLNQKLPEVVSLNLGCAVYAGYYAFRFGTLRVFSLILVFLFSWVSLLQFFSSIILTLLWAFLLDLGWNWWLKRSGIVIPGSDP